MYEDYKPGKSPVVPMWVTGELDGSIETGSTIAVGVNGKIMGTTKSFDFKGAQHFGTLVNPDSLVAGKNAITVYEVGPGNSLKGIGATKGPYVPGGAGHFSAPTRQAAPLHARSFASSSSRYAVIRL